MSPGGDAENQKLQEKVAQTLVKLEAKDPNASVDKTTEEEKLKLNEIRKAAGNLMTTAAFLATDSNGLNMRCLLTVVKPTWTEHAQLSRQKLRATDNAARARALAHGAGEEILKDIVEFLGWKDVRWI